MEQQPGEDPEHDGSAGPQPGDASPGPAAPGFPSDSASPGASPSGPSGSDGSGADAAASSSSTSGPGKDADAASASPDADAGLGTDGGGESVFGPWDALEGTLGAAKEREELLSGFASGGVWDKHPPGPELAAALARAAGPDWRCASATGEEKVGLLRGMAALQSWAGAGMLGMVRALVRDDDQPYLGHPRHGDLPDEWDDSLVAEIALALAVSVPSAERTTRAAWELGARLPGVELLLRDGTLDVPRARLVTEVFAELSDENAARAEELLLPELTAPPRKTYTQVERIATAIAAAVDPGLAERRRESAQKHRSRVTVFRERAGTAGLSGRDLPVGETLAAYANLDARAKQYKDSGAFPGERLDRLRAAAYLDVLNGICADDRIACGHLGSEATLATDPGDAADGDAPADHGPSAGLPGRSGPRRDPVGRRSAGGSDCPCDECDGSCAPPDDNDFPDDDLDDGESDDGESDDGEPDDGEPDDGEDPEGGGPIGSGGRGSPGRGGPQGGSKPPTADGPAAGGADNRPGPRPARSAPRSPFLRPPGGPPPTLTDLVFPLATLLGHAERPGEGHSLGTIDPALCRALAATAALSPHTTICVTVTDADGIAIGHGCVRSGRLARPPGGPPPPLVGLPAGMNLTITAARLAEMLARPDPPDPGGSPSRPDPRAAHGWAFAPHGNSGGKSDPGDPDWCGPWALTLPSGLERTLNIAPVPTYDCDHRNESHAYKPNSALRHLVQIRDYSCTFPPCSRHARESDFEHAIPYDQGGRTCGCNAGARSRKCHRVKQSRGWNVTQPKPGWHQWSTPRGRTYTQGPEHYPV
jgi:hypothetical protein